jgi:hypothetical protein
MEITILYIRRGVSMYKLIVVDDEKLIREGIVKGNPWHEWPYYRSY